MYTSQLVYNRPQFIAFLIHQGIHPNSVNKAGETPLHSAASNDALQSIEKLLESKADINIQDEDGMTPLMKAISYCQSNAALLLISKGADIRILDKKENTPLLVAIEKQQRGNRLI